MSKLVGRAFIVWIGWLVELAALAGQLAPLLAAAGLSGWVWGKGKHLFSL